MSRTFYSSDTTLEEDTDTTTLTEEYLPTLEEAWSEQKLERCKSWVAVNKFKRISLQFPDTLLGHSVRIYEDLKTVTEAEVFILGDTSYGSCCVDEVAASHVDSDALIHFGQACLSRNTRLPVLYVFLHFSVNFEDFKEKIRSVDGEEKLIIFADTAYYHARDQFLEEVSSRNGSVASLVVDDSVKADYLGWSVQEESLEESTCVFVGEDDQTFFNLSLAIPATWILYNPKKETLSAVTSRTSSWFRRRFYYLEVCKDAQMIGIVMGTLTSSGYLEMAKRIQSLATECGKKTILLSVGKINPAKLANFSDVDCFVLIGCPQNNVFNSRDFYKPILTTFEVELALNPAWRDTIPNTYCMDFQELLPTGKYHKHHDQEVNLNQEGDVSLITGRVREANRNGEPEGGTGSELLERGSGIVSNRVTEAFQERSWRGLDPALGQDAPARIVEGRSGIPIAYENKDEKK